jgi:hypothetical protein
MDDVAVLDWRNDRRFGVEIEVNAFDGRSRPEVHKSPPKGIEDVGELVSRTLEKRVTVTTWKHTHNNTSWQIKPDGSCGMEVITPILKGWNGLGQVCMVTDRFGKDERITADKRCSFHVHVNVADLPKQQIGSVLAHWLKCEAVFLDAMPGTRKRNRYCQAVGLCDMFQVDEPVGYQEVMIRLGTTKYYTINNFHLQQGNRDSVEVRLAENDACTDPYFAKNWVRLVVHFVEMASQKPFPKRYDPSDPWTGLAWLDPIDVLTLLGFMPGQMKLSPGLQQTRNWFLARMHKYTFDGNLGGIWSKMGRSIAYQQVQEIMQKLERQGVDFEDALHPKDMNDALFNEKFRY